MRILRVGVVYPTYTTVDCTRDVSFQTTPTSCRISTGYWIHKSALCAHILHEFVVLLEAKPSAKPQTNDTSCRLFEKV